MFSTVWLTVIFTLAGAAVGTSQGHAAPAAPRGGSTGSAGSGQAEPTRIRIDLPYQPHVTGTDLRPERVEIFARDKDVVRFLGKSEERAGVQQAVTKVTVKAKAEDFYEGPRLYQLEQRIARAVEAQIRKRTKRACPTLDLMLHAGQGYRIRTGGVMIRPMRPVLAPHRSP